MTRHSAGVLVFRRVDAGVEVLLGHMGGPFWSRRDAGAWSIPKGECGPGEDPFDAARREFREELGSDLPRSTVPHGSPSTRPDRRWCAGRSSRSTVSPTTYAASAAARGKMLFPQRFTIVPTGYEEDTA